MKATQNVQSISMQVLEALTKPKLTYNDRAKIIAEGFAQIEKKQFNFDNLATKSDIKETELKLTKETESIRLETKNLEVKLTSDNKNLEVKLIKEIEAVRKETEAIRLETKNLEVKLTKETKNLEVKLVKEIEAIRLETKNLEVKLVKEIEAVRKETEAIRLETKNLEVKLIREINNQKVEITKEISQSSKNTIKWTTGLIITMVITIASLILMK